MVKFGVKRLRRSRSALPLGGLGALLRSVPFASRAVRSSAKKMESGAKRMSEEFNSIENLLCSSVIRSANINVHSLVARRYFALGYAVALPVLPRSVSSGAAIVPGLGYLLSSLSFVERINSHFAPFLLSSPRLPLMRERIEQISLHRRRLLRGERKKSEANNKVHQQSQDVFAPVQRAIRVQSVRLFGPAQPFRWTRENARRRAMRNSIGACPAQPRAAECGMAFDVHSLNVITQHSRRPPLPAALSVRTHPCIPFSPAHFRSVLCSSFCFIRF